MRTSCGFTLLELIAAIVILGLVGMAGTLGLMGAMRGYEIAVGDTALATKAQIALTRINVELTHINFPYPTYNNASATLSGQGVSASSNTSITYDANFGSRNAAQICCVTTANNIIAYDAGGSRVTLNVGGTGAQTLCDNVTAFQLRYYNNYNTAAQNTFSQTNDGAGHATGTHIIEAAITVNATRYDMQGNPVTTPQTFTTRIVPKFR